jgi:hypothetical protein
VFEFETVPLQTATVCSLPLHFQTSVTRTSPVSLPIFPKFDASDCNTVLYSAVEWQHDLTNIRNAQKPTSRQVGTDNNCLEGILVNMVWTQSRGQVTVQKL